MLKQTVIVAACASFVVLGGCEDKSPSNAPATRDNPQTPLGRSAQFARDTAKKVTAGQDQASAVADGQLSPGDIVVSGLVFKTPPGWQRVQAGAMRAAELKFASPDGDVSVVFFAGIGGSMEQNIARWRGMVQPDRGGEPRTKDLTLAQSIPAKRLSMIGTYTGMAAGGAAMAPAPGTKFIGVVIDGPSGQVQVRLTGPDSVVQEIESAFDAMINGVQVK